MSLYRKYRPKDFVSLVGQEHIKTTILNAVKNGKLGHAYLFTGPRGTGKTTVARLLAKAVNSDSMSPEGLFVNCDIADEIDAGKLIDVLEIDAASNRGIDEIRDLREKINFAPTRAKNKVYIIDEVHMLTKEAFNALLKTLEEPPTFVYFILATTEISKVPETIISRCQRFDFKRITESDILARLIEVCETEGFEYEQSALQIIAKQSRGGLRDALSILEQIAAGKEVKELQTREALGLSGHGTRAEFFQLIKEAKTTEALNMIEKLYQDGVDLTGFTKDILSLLREKLLEAVADNQRLTQTELLAAIANFQEAQERQKISYVPQLPLEIAIVKTVLNWAGEQGGGMGNGGAGKTDSETRNTQPLESEEAKKKIEISNSVVTEQQSLTDDQLIKNWSATTARLHSGLVRTNLQQAKPLNFDGEKLKLGFSSNFYLDKLLSPGTLIEAEKMLSELLNKSISIEAQILQENAKDDNLGVFGDVLA